MRTLESLESHLRDQIIFLQNSSRLFDEGWQQEAKRLALNIRVLIHDTDRSTSLLKLLGVKEDLQYLNTVPPINPRNILPESNFLICRVSSNQISYLAPLADSPWFDIKNVVNFETWRNQVVYKDGESEWSRWNFINWLANKEGGGHVHPTPVASYDETVREGESRWTMTAMDEDSRTVISKNPQENLVYVGLRQIAFEILETLKQYKFKS